MSVWLGNGSLYEAYNANGTSIEVEVCEIHRLAFCWWYVRSSFFSLYINMVQGNSFFKGCWGGGHWSKSLLTGKSRCCCCCHHHQNLYQNHHQNHHHHINSFFQASVNDVLSEHGPRRLIFSEEVTKLSISHFFSLFSQELLFFSLIPVILSVFLFLQFYPFKRVTELDFAYSSQFYHFSRASLGSWYIFNLVFILILLIVSILSFQEGLSWILMIVALCILLLLYIIFTYFCLRRLCNRRGGMVDIILLLLIIIND